MNLLRLWRYWGLSVGWTRKQNLSNMRMLKTLLIVLSLPHFAFGGGFSSWGKSTPGGNEIFHESLPNEEFMMILCGKGYNRGLDHLERWYYYQSHIVGTYWENGVLGYFIFNEANCECQTFINLETFERQKRELRLEPKIWTRWHSFLTEEGGIGIPEGAVPFLFLTFCLIVFTPILLIITRFSPKNRINQFLLLAWCLIAAKVWLNCHLQSFWFSERLSPLVTETGRPKSLLILSGTKAPAGASFFSKKRWWDRVERS